jgi:hypothetical protein
MTDLIKRLEEAEAGSRELDREIAKLIDKAEWDKCANWASMPCGAPPDVIDRDALRWLPAYTTSIDGALALAERLGLDGWHLLYAAMLNWKAHDPRGPLSKTLPLALCIAILKATDTGREG